MPGRAPGWAPRHARSRGMCIACERRAVLPASVRPPPYGRHRVVGLGRSGAHPPCGASLRQPPPRVAAGVAEPHPPLQPDPAPRRWTTASARRRLGEEGIIARSGRFGVGRLRRVDPGVAARAVPGGAVPAPAVLFQGAWFRLRRCRSGRDDSAFRAPWLKPAPSETKSAPAGCPAGARVDSAGREATSPRPCPWAPGAGAPGSPAGRSRSAARSAPPPTCPSGPPRRGSRRR